MSLSRNTGIEMAAGTPIMVLDIGITVYPFIYERVNRYAVNFGNMFTLPVTYGEMFLIEKAVVDADWSLERKGA